MDGGASANDFLMQFQADISDCRVVRPKISESTAWGAAALAGLGAEVWSSPQDIHVSDTAASIFTPKMTPQLRSRAVSRWHKAVARTCSNNPA